MKSENLTVISGVLYLGMGEKFDRGPNPADNPDKSAKP